MISHDTKKCNAALSLFSMPTKCARCGNSVVFQLERSILRNEMSIKRIHKVNSVYFNKHAER